MFLRFLAGGHFSEIIFVPQQKKTGVGNITLHTFSSKSSANCDLDEIKLVVLLSSLFFKTYLLFFFFFVKFRRALESANI